MNARINHQQLLRFAGLFTWGMVGIPLLYAGWQGFDQSGLSSGSVSGWIFSYLAFGVLYLLVTGQLNIYRRGWRDSVSLLLLTLFAIAVSYYSETGLGSMLLTVIAGILPWLLPVRLGSLWLIVSHLLVIPVFIFSSDGLTWWEAFLQSLLYAGFSTFVFVTGYVAKQQAAAREEQRRLIAELRAARTLLAENSRVGERLRISRELHDLLGHHLTALSLNLEVAGHLSEGKAQEHVRQSHALAKLLLSDVREAVSEMREGCAIDILAAIAPLVQPMPNLDIHLHADPDLTLEDSGVAQVILRCVQELITNTIKHARASKLELSLQKLDNLLILKSEDDGVGATLARLGNGLQGMKERVRALNGKLLIQSTPGHGFSVSITLPLGE
ncbi:sensor histidine kinase [Arenimonas sp.]|jgi:signal transduction histidine kinase|uniref:sensor histidine kinase n=1 Tax=Arenimonas sp. TaxID=1872635 RepID=UPI0037BE95CE